jgi:hypothetical protein
MIIDALITYVDGNDPQLIAKRNQYSKEKISNHDLKILFESSIELEYCILSIFKYASFIRNIFILTDDQELPKFDLISKKYPSKIESIKRIDHRDVFKNHLDLLPVFNSGSIETFMWNFKELSENFVFFNDDFILNNYITKEDWFKNNKPIVFGKKVFKKRPKPEGYKGIDHKRRQYLAFEKLNNLSFYISSKHIPQPMKKSNIEELYHTNPEIFINNAKHKFRAKDQFSFIAFFKAIQINRGNDNNVNQKEVYIARSLPLRKKAKTYPNKTKVYLPSKV